MPPASFPDRRRRWAVLAAGTVAAALPAVATAQGRFQHYAYHVSVTPGLLSNWHLEEGRWASAYAAARGPAAVRLTVGDQVDRGRRGAIGRGDRAFGFRGGVPDRIWASCLRSGADAFPFGGTAPFSLELWVRPDLTDDNGRRLFSREDASGGYLLSIRSGGVFFSRYLNAGTFAFADGVGGTVAGSQMADADTVQSAPVPRDAWTYVVATYDGSTERLYVDGVLAAAAAGSVSLAGSNVAADPPEFAIGCGRGGYLEYDGVLDEPAVYAGALSADEVALHYAAGASRQ